MDRFEEARRRAAQSLKDLKAAEYSFMSKNYEWSCFQVQQAAEKAVKALLYLHGMSSWGHSVTELLDYVSVGFGSFRRGEEVGGSVSERFKSGRRQLHV